VQGLIFVSGAYPSEAPWSAPLHWILWTFIKVLDKVFPTFGHYSWNEWKLMKLSQCLTDFPSHFNSIFLKSFGLLNLKFYWYNTLLSFSCDVLCWLLVLLLVLSKVDCKISVLFWTDSKFWGLELGDGESYKNQYCSYLEVLQSSGFKLKRYFHWLQRDVSRQISNFKLPESAKLDCLCQTWKTA